MPTKKELLSALQEEAIYLRESIDENTFQASLPVEVDTENIENMIQNSIEALANNEEGISKALENLSDSIDSAVSKFFDGLFWGALAGGGLYILVKYIKNLNKKTSLIKSIEFLEKEHTNLTYDFIIERSSANRANKEDRQTILNELIHGKIVTSYKHNDKVFYKIDSDSPELAEHWRKAKEFGSELMIL